MKMKKIIMKSLSVLTIVVFMVSSAMAEKSEYIVDDSNVFPSGKHYALNMTGKTDKAKKATAAIELQTSDPYISPSDCGGGDAATEKLRMILLLMCMPATWQTIPMNIQLR
jgi:hypothetical protein